MALATAVLLAGCVQDDPFENTATGEPGPGEQTDEGENTTAPPLGPPVDPWQGLDELVVYDGTHRGVSCTIGGTPDQPEALWTPCSNTDLVVPDGPFIPEGSKTLRVEADATDALKAGSYHFYLYTNGRNTWDIANAQRTDSAVHTWEIELTSLDWDPVYRTKSAVKTGFWPSGSGINTLHGDIDAVFTVERDPGWEPRVPVDEFLLADKHDVVAPGVVRLVDTNETWAFDSPALTGLGMLGSSFPEEVPLGVIPAGTKQVAYGFSWSETDCPPEHDCSPDPFVRRGAHWPIAQEVERGPSHAVYVLDVPEVLADDGPYADAGTATIVPFARRCAEPLAPTGLECLASFYLFGATLETRVLAEAWNNDVDLEAFKARLGVVG